jgi:predicted nucleic acid-binding protein
MGLTARPSGRPSGFAEAAPDRPARSAQACLADACALIVFHALGGADWDIAARAATLPPHHRDPLDRILIATALAAGLPIVTNDAAFAAYGVPTLW